MISPLQRTTLRNLLLAAGTLCCVGLIAIYAASSVFALEQRGVAHYFVARQLYALIGGALLIIAIAHIGIEWIYRLTPWGFFSMLVLIAFPLLIPTYARTIHGSARWITIMGISFQPVEFAKVAFVLMLAHCMSRPKFSEEIFWKSIVPIFIITVPFTILLLAQPDFGQAALCVLTGLTMLAIAHNELNRLLALLAGTGAIAALLILMKPYRVSRLLTFLNPWNDPQGKGFQVIQSLIAIGSGGLMGIGIGQSRQKFFYLPMQHTDFIFSIIAEETGLLGATFLISLYLLFLYSSIRLALYAETSFARLTLFGLTTMISLQAIINLTVATGLAPTKGIGLPFVSYGLSSLLAHCCMIGIIIACTQDPNS